MYRNITLLCLMTRTKTARSLVLPLAAHATLPPQQPLIHGTIAGRPVTNDLVWILHAEGGHADTPLMYVTRKITPDVRYRYYLPQ